MDSLITQRDSVNSWMFRYGVRFGIYKNGEFKEQIFPFDAIARKISGREWQRLERGLIQRVNALNLFLNDIYGDKKIVKDNVVPEDFVYSSKGYLPFCEGLTPPKVTDNAKILRLKELIESHHGENHGEDFSEIIDCINSLFTAKI